MELTSGSQPVAPFVSKMVDIDVSGGPQEAEGTPAGIRITADGTFYFTLIGDSTEHNIEVTAGEHLCYFVKTIGDSTTAEGKLCY
jgi:hypothetical protein